MWQDLGTTRLTWRRLAVLLRHLPAESATVRAVQPSADGHYVWQVSDVLLAHIFQAVAHSKDPHPMLKAELDRNKASTGESPQRAARRAEARRRSLGRQQLIDAGIIQ